MRLAKAIADGIEQYVRANPPPGTLIANMLDTQNTQELRYTIARGDTLSEIAARYGVSSGRLKRHNGLSSDRIRVGQTLRIPQGS